MKLSILLVSYNQINFIDQCLDGIFIQNFEDSLEIIIADDFSTDGTSERLKARLEDSRFKVKFLKADKNLGVGKNYLRGIEACSGEYVAFLEGDDYWTDPLRLQKHIQFLEKNPTCPMSFNPFGIYVQKTNSLSIPQSNDNREVVFFSSKQLIQYNVIGNLSVCVFKKTSLDSIPKIFFELDISDWFIGIFLAQHHPVAQLNEVMSVYRINSNGLWSKLSSEYQQNQKKRMTYVYDSMLGYKYSKEFLALRMASRIKKLRDDRKAKLPKQFEQITDKMISYGLILRVSLAIAYLTPKRMISKNEKYYYKNS